MRERWFSQQAPGAVNAGCMCSCAAVGTPLLGCCGMLGSSTRTVRIAVLACKASLFCRRFALWGCVERSGMTACSAACSSCLPLDYYQTDIKPFLLIHFLSPCVLVWLGLSGFPGLVCTFNVGSKGTARSCHRRSPKFWFLPVLVHSRRARCVALNVNECCSPDGIGCRSKLPHSLFNHSTVFATPDKCVSGFT